LCLINVSIANIQYSPASLTIKAGDSVTWTNYDERDHTVIAQDGSFSSPVIRRGESFTFQFDKAGKYASGCKLHPRMKGTIIVLPPRAIAFRPVMPEGGTPGSSRRPAV
jgi:plastocyanin